MPRIAASNWCSSRPFLSAVPGSEERSGGCWAGGHATDSSWAKPLGATSSRGPASTGTCARRACGPEANCSHHPRRPEAPPQPEPGRTGTRQGIFVSTCSGATVSRSTWTVF